MIINVQKNKRGSALISTLVFGMVAVSIVAMSISSYAIFEHRASLAVNERDMAFHIAEAGANYYRWHLAHNPTDYTDGIAGAGPYIHSYSNKDGNIVGYFEIQITPPLPGATVVTVKSIGYTSVAQSIRRAVEIQLATPSLSNFTFLANANMNFSSTTQVHGAVFSNGGIKFDGVTDSWVQSAKQTYLYSGATHNGVWGAGGPVSFWKFPLPAVDFFGVTADLAKIRDAADDGGTHLTTSGVEGWHIIFRGNNYDLYRVNSRSCHTGAGVPYCYDINNETFVQNSLLPTNGYVFSEDDVWVDGTINGRVTIAVGRFPVVQPYKKIYIPNNLLYTTKGGTDVIGLVSQGDIIVPYTVPNNMEINAGLLSQFGTLSHPYYDNNTRNSLTIFGSQISYLQGGWKYVNGFGTVVSGFVNTYHSLDGNLKFYPPPGFPVGDVYEVIGWKEVAP